MISKEEARQMPTHPFQDRQAVSLDEEGCQTAEERIKHAQEKQELFAQRYGVGQLPVRAQVLRKAESLICGDRNQEYGTPYESHARIAALWSAYLGVPIRPYEAAIMLSLMKASRSRTDHKQDTFDDGAGYFALAFEILEEEKRAR